MPVSYRHQVTTTPVNLIDTNKHLQPLIASIVKELHFRAIWFANSMGAQVVGLLHWLMVAASSSVTLLSHRWSASSACPIRYSTFYSWYTAFVNSSTRRCQTRTLEAVPARSGFEARSPSLCSLSFPVPRHVAIYQVDLVLRLKTRRLFIIAFVLGVQKY